MKNELICPYLGCGKPIPCNPHIKQCPHCKRSINIVALAALRKPMEYIQNITPCAYCGNDRTGKGSLIAKGRVFCDDDCFNYWNDARLEKYQ